MFLRPRIIPVLSIQDGDLVKTIQFENPRYIGDPINTVKIFNDKGADELCILDITASKEKKIPNFRLLEEIANEAFMPLSYGGGLTTLDQVKKIIRMGYEKVIFNSSFFTNSKLISDTVDYLGSSGVVISLDVKKDLVGNYKFYLFDGTQRSNFSISDVINRLQELNVGEVILNSINHDGMMDGYDFGLLELFGQSINVPLILLGGAKDVNDFRNAKMKGADSVAASSMFIFYGLKKAVLISYPDANDLPVDFMVKK